jgi:hypothetical protein
LEELVKRARVTLNTLLFVSLVIVWSAYNKPQNLVEEVNSLKKLITQYSSKEDDKTNEDEASTKFSGIYQVVSNENIEDILISDLVNIDTRLFGKNLMSEIFDKGAIVRKTDSSYLFERPSSKNPAKNNKIIEIPINDYNFLYYPGSTKDSIIDQLNAIREIVYSEQSNFNSETKVSDFKSRLKTTISLPFIEEQIDTDKAVTLMSFFLLGPLLILISLIQTITETSTHNNEGNSWIFFHPGKLGLIMGVIQIFIPFLATVYVIVMGRMKLVYIIPLSIIVLALGIWCTYEVVKARKSFYPNP